MWHPDCDLSQKCKIPVDEVLTQSCISFVKDGKVFSCQYPFRLQLSLLKWSQFSKLLSSQPETKSLGHFLTWDFEPAQFHSSFEAARTWVLRAPTRYVHKSKYGQLWSLLLLTSHHPFMLMRGLKSRKQTNEINCLSCVWIVLPSPDGLQNSMTVLAVLPTVEYPAANDAQPFRICMDLRSKQMHPTSWSFQNATLFWVDCLPMALNFGIVGDCQV